MRSTLILMPAVCLTLIGCAIASSPIGPRSRTLPSSLCSLSAYDELAAVHAPNTDLVLEGGVA